MKPLAETSKKTSSKVVGTKYIKVLMLEDNPSDIELIIANLNTSNLVMEHAQAGNQADFEHLLITFHPDLILSDYQLPQYSGQRALEFSLMHAPDVPFILVTGALGEEEAVRMIQSGATDFLLKKNLHNLNAAILRALRLADEKKAKNMAIELMERSEKHFRGLIENSYDPIIVFDQDGIISYCSPSFTRLLGYTYEEVNSRNVTDFVNSEDVKRNWEEFQLLLASKKKKVFLKQRLIQQNGNYRWIEAVLSDQRMVPGVGAFVGNLRDIHEHVVSREELNEQYILLNSVLSSLSEGVIVASKEQEILLYNKAAERMFGATVSKRLKSNPGINYKSDMNTEYREDELPLHRALNGESIDDFPLYLKFDEKQPGIHLSINSRPLHDQENRLVGGISSYRDVSRMRHYQFELERTLANLENRVKERTEELLLAHQNLRDAHRHMTYSINYAQKIQQAITPSIHEIQSAFKEAFVIYKPKDIVSGDFIWLNQKGGCHLAVVDCTGHGVPGAMMSMLGLELLERIIHVRQIQRPEIVLEELDKAVTRLMKRDGSDNPMNDGMDISLCSFDFERNEISFAGAYNHGILIRKEETIILEADKHSIGGFRGGRRKEFNRSVVTFKPGDRIYLFTDGFQDQFGGPNTKKFTKKRLTTMIKENQHLSLKEQERLFSKAFEEWQGYQLQIDDVTLVGIEL